MTRTDGVNPRFDVMTMGRDDAEPAAAEVEEVPAGV